SERARSKSAIGPSYSSPWLPPVRSAGGPCPFFTTVSGIITEPQAESSRLEGRRKKPCWTPSAEKSTVGRIGDGRNTVPLMAASILDDQLARHIGEAFNPGIGDQDAFRRLEAHVLEPEARHEMEGHARLQLGPVSRAKAHGALAPVRRIGQADRITRAVVLHDAVLLQHTEEGVGDVLAGIAGPCDRKAGLHPFERRLFGIEESLGRLAEKDGARQR